MAIKKEDYWIKPTKKLLEYQMGLFRRELKRVEAGYNHLLENKENRKKSYGVTFASGEELREAYIAGVIDEAEFSRQRSLLWYVYSDRGYPAKLAWLRGELNIYEEQYNELMRIIDEKRQKTKERERRRKSAYKKRYKRKKRARGRSEIKEGKDNEEREYVE